MDIWDLITKTAKTGKHKEAAASLSEEQQVEFYAHYWDARHEHLDRKLEMHCLAWLDNRWCDGPDCYEWAPWEGVDVDDSPVSFSLWYEGVPEDIERDREHPLSGRSRPHWLQVRTAICDLSYGEPPTSIWSGGREWKLSYIEALSAEAECPAAEMHEEGEHPWDPAAAWAQYRDDDDPTERPRRCPYCDEDVEKDGHGYVYQGDGWSSVIYVRQEVFAAPDLSRLDREALEDIFMDICAALWCDTKEGSRWSRDIDLDDPDNNRAVVGGVLDAMSMYDVEPVIVEPGDE